MLNLECFIKPMILSILGSPESSLSDATRGKYPR